LNILLEREKLWWNKGAHIFSETATARKFKQ
jgi:hypothetical protein